MRTLRNLIGLAIIASLAAAFFTWTPETVPQSPEEADSAADHLILALDSLAEKIPSLQQDIRNLSEDIKDRLAKIRDAREALPSLPMTAGRESPETEEAQPAPEEYDRATVEQLNEWLRSYSKQLDERDREEWSGKLDTILEQSEKYQEV